MSRPKTRDFVHLHNHSDFSRLDGSIKVESLVRLAHEDGHRGIALTDHGQMGGVVQLFQEAKKYDMQAIPGAEAYFVQDAHEGDPLFPAGYGKRRYHMTLLAVTSTGYHNLVRIMSRATIDENYRHGDRFPLIDEKLLFENSEGIVATSGCIGSRFNQILLSPAFDKEESLRHVSQSLGRFKEVFGERFFIELGDHGIKEQKQLLSVHADLSKRLGIPLLAGQDTHYARPEDADFHDAMLCMEGGSHFHSQDRFRFDSHENYFRTAEEMYRLFPDAEYPNACSNTVAVAEMAQGLDIIPPKGTFLIPEFPDAQGDEKGLLRERVYQGAKEIAAKDGKDDLDQEVVEQIEHELDVLDRAGYNGYMLIVQDIVAFARESGIRVGPGRGSAAGSYVSYALGITKIPPLDYELSFERFLNLDRVGMPDVDIDFDPARRWEVQQHVVDKYGSERVAAIGTWGTLRPKAAVKAMCRVLDVPIVTANEISKLLPGVGISIAELLADEAPEKEDKARLYRDHVGFRDFYKAKRREGKLKEGQTPDRHEIAPSLFPGEYAEQGRKFDDQVLAARNIVLAIDLAEKAEGFFSQQGKHAAGLLITPGPVWEHVPVHRAKDSEIPATSFDKNDIEVVGGLKMDLLGLSNLTLIEDCLDFVRRDLGVDLDIDNLPLDDFKTLELFRQGETDGVFQFESEGMKKMLKRMAPTSFRHIAAATAVYRPGPMGTKMHEDLADRIAGRKDPVVEDDYMLDLFAETSGLMIYQEQLLALVQHYAGFTAREADTLRKATGKKDAVLIAAQEEKFKAGVVRNGYPQSLADRLWAKIPSFAEYSFNKAHAVAYGLISYQIAYLKTHFKAQFTAAALASLDRDRMPAQIDAAIREGISVKLPDINKSEVGPRTSRDTIWLGLGLIAHCGSATLDPIIETRRSLGRPFESIFEVVSKTFARTGRAPSTKSLTSLAQAGAFDSFGISRKKVIEQITRIVEVAKAEEQAEAVESADFFGLGDIVENESDLIDLVGEDFTRAEKTLGEYEALGIFPGEHPMKQIQAYQKTLVREGILRPTDFAVGSPDVKPGPKVSLYGTVSAVKKSKTKSGRIQFVATLENGRGDTVTARIFDAGVEKDLQPGALAVVTGRYTEEDSEDGVSFTMMVNEVDVFDFSEVITLIDAAPLSERQDIEEVHTPQSFEIHGVENMHEVEKIALSLLPYLSSEESDTVSLRLPTGTLCLPYNFKVSERELAKELLRIDPAMKIRKVS